MLLIATVFLTQEYENCPIILSCNLYNLANSDHLTVRLTRSELSKYLFSISKIDFMDNISL